MNRTAEFLTPLKEEIHAIDYRWVALESFSDLLCVLMAVYVALPGIRKLWPYHEGYVGTKKGFIWLAATWGVPNYPHLFRTVTGMVEISVFVGCLMCFLPGPTWQLVTCLALVMGMALCISFMITHKADPWRQILGVFRHFLQAGIALGIRLYQDFDWSNPQLVKPLYVGSSLIVVGLVYMIYRRARYGKVPDPLLG
jgi:hypothetical protein